MDKLKYFLLLAVFPLLSANHPPGDSLPRNGCEQQFNFFLKTQFEDLFWVGESLGGECGVSRLVQVHVKDLEPSVIEMTLKDYNDWSWVEAADGYLRREHVIPLEKRTDNCFVNKIGSKIKIKAPGYSQKLLNIYHEELGATCGESWNNAMGSEGIELPKIPGKDPKLVYFHPKGLYFNYEISEVYFYPESSYAVVFTENEQRCANLDTMHGFMILKLD